MRKKKLTLYIDEETSTLAHQVASRAGKSVSAMVKEFFMAKKEVTVNEVARSVKQWSGTLKTKKTYKELRDEIYNDLGKDHEGND